MILEFKSKVIIYTDGACAGNPGPGGWGALLRYNNTFKEFFGYELYTTNNRMEMLAAIKALEVLKRFCDVEIHTDSEYLQKGVTKWIFDWQRNNWKKENNIEIKNVDLWKILFNEIKKHNINWYWVKSHSYDRGNIIADSLAIKGKEIAISKLK